MSLNIDYLILEEKLDSVIARLSASIARSEPVDCPPPDSNGAASVVVTPVEPGQGVGSSSATSSALPKVAKRRQVRRKSTSLVICDLFDGVDQSHGCKPQIFVSVPPLAVPLPSRASSIGGSSLSSCRAPL